MPSLADHKNDPLVKILYIGDSSTGKTGSLVSLVEAGYRIRMLDYDMGIGTLASFVKRQCPDRLGQIDYIPLRDKMKIAPSAKYGGQKGPVTDGTPKAFTSGLDFMTKWEDGSIPAEWGPDTIFVLDSLSAFARSAYDWAFSLNPAAKDPRQWFFAAQQGVENVVSLLTNESFATNVIVITHVNYKEIVEGQTKGYANAIGTALGPILPRYFNNLVLAESTGIGKMQKRRIKTVPTGIIDLKTSVSHTVEAELPLETGMATLFSMIKSAT